MRNDKGKLFLNKSSSSQFVKSTGQDVEKVTIYRVTRDSKQVNEDVVVRELPLTIILNGRELVTLLCSPSNLKYLAIGFLFAEGLIISKNDIERITVNESKGIAHIETISGSDGDEAQVFKRIITPGCGRGAAFYNAADAFGMKKVDSKLQISGAEILDLMKQFQLRSETYRSTGGVHSAALCNKEEVLLFSEDIGRHNAIDKIFGQRLWEGIPTHDQIVFTSGRVSSEIVIKIARSNVPILASKSAPTGTAVKLANSLGITLIGFVRGMRMNVYSQDQRIVNNT